jgi:hypothetical protein
MDAGREPARYDIGRAAAFALAVIVSPVLVPIGLAAALLFVALTGIALALTPLLLPTALRRLSALRVDDRGAARALTLGIAACAAAAGALIHLPSSLPAIALGSEIVLRLEYVFVVFIGLLFFAVVLVSGLWRGVLPTEISREGVKYSDVSKEAKAAAESLTERVEKQRGEIERVGKAVDAVVTSLHALGTDMVELDRQRLALDRRVNEVENVAAASGRRRRS